MANVKVNINRFKNLCFVGLNKVEFHPEGGDVMFAENWMDLIDDQARRSMMLGFFAPRDLSGDPMDPEEVLTMGQHTAEDSTFNFIQQVKSISLFDFCRIEKAAPNTVNILVVADVIFHWDMNDNFVTPTTPESWVRDVTDIINQYPRQTARNIYTAWDTSLAQEELKDIKFHNLREMPLDSGMWLNMPSIQEKYANHSLVAGIVVALGIYGFLYYQSGTITNLQRQVQVAQQRSGGVSDLRTMQQKVNEVENFQKHGSIFSLILKDVALAIDSAGFAIDAFTIENPSPTNPADALIATLTSKENAYRGFAQEEAISKAILRNSATITAVRKPPAPNALRLTLEGLIPLSDVSRDVAEYQRIARANQKETPAEEAEKAVEPPPNAPVESATP